MRLGRASRDGSAGEVDPSPEGGGRWGWRLFGQRVDQRRLRLVGKGAAESERAAKADLVGAAVAWFKSEGGVEFRGGLMMGAEDGRLRVRARGFRCDGWVECSESGPYDASIFG